MDKMINEDLYLRTADAVLVSGLGELGARKNKDDTSTREIIHRSTHLTNPVIGRVSGACSGTYKGDRAVLLITEFTFIQRYVKLKQANIEMKFNSRIQEARKSRDQKEPAVCIICPSQLYGTCSMENQTVTMEGEADIGVSAGPVHASAKAGASKETSSEKHRQVSITGDMDCDEYHDVCNKVFFEVKGNSEHFPRNVFLAVVVRQASKLQVEVDVWLNNINFTWISQLWTSDDPLWLPIGIQEGSVRPASLNFEELSVEDWKALIPFQGSRKVSIVGNN